MKNIWFVLWLILLLLQLITYWLGKQLSNPVTEVDRELLELAQATNEEWQLLLPAESSTGTPPDEGMMFARESLLMEMRKLESELQDKEAKVDVSEILAKWYSVREDNLNRAEFLGYLDGVCLWLGRLSQLDEDCRIERIYLLPDGLSQYPVLTLEMTGPPSLMGRRLSEAVEEVPGLRVVELDLNKTVTGESWWMLGSCRYDREAI
ncbi:MAG: hypothetical protein AB3N63_10305 [Puniceicoccaceae bacterium]